MVRSGYDEEGRSVVEFDTDDIFFVERNLAGRETIRQLTDTIVEELLVAREQGRNTYSGDRILRLAYERARKLVAEKAAQHEHTPLR
jgi:hypothetical protein